MSKRIQSALLSVYHKDGLDRLVHSLHRLQVKLYATGGTYDFIKAMNIPVTPVEDVTGYPSILDGRVKTLHPAVFGGILARRDDATHQAEMSKYQLPYIDLVVVDLYPFEATVAAGSDEASIIEKIDIGGISLIRGAAKNFGDVLIIPTVKDYPVLQHILDKQDGVTKLEQRRQQALSAFRVSGQYDTAIGNWFSGMPGGGYSGESKALRYGENPHQDAVYHGRLDEVFNQLNGKDLSYNNLLDADAALALISEFEEPCMAVIKHNNACGLATDESLLTAWNKALAGDPVSAFGGVIASNRPISKEVAEAMNSLFFEVLLAPAYAPEALELLKGKKNRIILETKSITWPKRKFRSVLNGLLEQAGDDKTEQLSDLRCVTEKAATADELQDLVFAAKVCKHSKSNAITLVKGKQLLGSGVGQTSRVDALRQAIEKATHFGFDLRGAVMASDAFFPFPDCVQIAAEAGISSIVQPGGSIKDQDSINEANQKGLSMVLTGIRHFKH